MTFAFNGDADDYANWINAILNELAARGYHWSRGDLEDVYEAYTLKVSPSEVADEVIYPEE